jgi:hypothetical protein
MFATHQSEIGKYARDNADNMARVITFVYATIQQPLNTVTDTMEDIDETGGASIYLWGWKRGAWLWLQEHKEEVHKRAMDIYDGHADPETVEHELLKYFASLPGLGLVKGGFVIQLCFGLSGCMDRHNMARFDIKENAFAAGRFKNAKTNKTRNALVRDYHATVAACGGTAALWNDWCAYLANKYEVLYSDAWQVSALHIKCINCG